MGLGFGRKATLAYKKQTDYDTQATTGLQKLELLSWDIVPSNAEIFDRSLYGATSRRAIYASALQVQGRFRVRGNYLGLTNLLTGVGGTAASVARSAPNAAVYDTTYKENDTLPSYTLEIDPGGISAGKVNIVVGAKIVDFTLGAVAGTGDDGMVTVEFNVIAKDYLVDQTAGGSPVALPNVSPMFFHHGVLADLQDGFAMTGSTLLREFELKVANALSDARFYIGSKNVAEPVRRDFCKATLRIVQELTGQQGFTGIKNFTQAQVRIHLKDTGTTIGSTANPELDIVLPKAYPTDFSQTIDGPEELTCNTTWEGIYDTTGSLNSSWKMILTSTDQAA